MKIVTSKIILIKDIFGGYTAHYKDSLEGKLHKFTDENKELKEENINLKNAALVIQNDTSLRWKK